MEQGYVYIDEYPEDELTFRKIGRFLKKSWLRMLVYGLIALAVAALIAVPIKVYYNSEQMAVTSIEFVYDGIEKGENPNGGSFDRDLIISPRVLTAAVEAAGLSEKITEISTLRASMRVDAVPDEEYIKLVEDAANGDSKAQETLRQTTFYPTRFDIIISEPSELGLTDSEAVLLLEKVVACYYEDFADRYSVTKMFSASVFSMTDEPSTLEFVDIYDLYVDSIKPVYDFLFMLENEKPAFVSSKNNATFSSLISEYNTIKLNLDMFNNYILVNNVWKNKTTALDSLNESKKRVTNELETLSSYVDALKEQIANIQPHQSTVITPTGTTTTTTYPDIYFEYQDKLNAAQLQIKSMTDQLNNIELRLEKIDDAQEEISEDVMTAATAMLRKIEDMSSAYVNKVNATIADYYDTTVISNSVRQVRPAMVTRMESTLNLVVILVVAFVVGLFVGGITTAVKISNSKLKAKQAVRPSDADIKNGTDKGKTDSKKE